jgi:plastocyanin
MPVLTRVLLACFAGCSTAILAATPAADTPACGAIGCAVISAQEISGVITVNRRLTKPSVTAAVSVYQRGTMVGLAKDAAGDPLAFERARVVVYLEGPLPTAAARHETFRMDQANRRFSPDLLVVPVGATVSFPNMDPIFHNIFSLSKPKEFDLGSYDRGGSRSITFSKPGIVYVYCHLHPNMEGTIVIAPSQYFAHVNGAGQFRLPAVPPGEYTVVAWHKAAGFFRKRIVVQVGHNATADFLIPLPAEPQKDAEPEHSMAQMGGK